MAKIKTRDLIIDIALLLFNERGERLVNSVDLAHEMNISPGNLYYHFKGKEEIVEELYARFHSNLIVVIDSFSTDKELNAKHLLTYLEIIADLFVEYRFITQDMVGLGANYPSIKPQLVKSMRRLHKKVFSLVSQLPKQASLQQIDNAPSLLTDNILNTLLYNNAYDSIINSGVSLAESTTDENNVIQDRLRLQLLLFFD